LNGVLACFFRDTAGIKRRTVKIHEVNTLENKNGNSKEFVCGPNTASRGPFISRRE
jgi:hypothetical protein